MAFSSPRAALPAWSPALALGGLLLTTPPCAARESPPQAAGDARNATGVASGATVFSDVAAKTGLDFVHFNGMTGQLYFTEMTGQGGALFDYDGDGDLDVYLVQGAPLGEGRSADLPGGEVPRDRLYRNLLETFADGRRELRFVDVTAEAGIDAGGYGMGVAAGDYDNDGRVDLYVTNYGSNRLLRNLGDGRFADVTASSGTDDARWSTGAAFVDYDRDGWLDLFVVNYVDYRIEDAVSCYAGSSRPDYCGPSAFAPVPDRLLRNRGDGRFEDVTAAALAPHSPGAGLGVVAADLDEDGWTEIYVTNDGLPNHHWKRGEDGRWVDEALFAGTALNHQGVAEASMGVDAGDFDADGDEDLFMSHLAGETNTLYVNDGSGLFEDRSIFSGLGPPSRPFTGFGTGWVDFDNDTWLDVLVVNGAVRLQEAGLRAGDPYPLGQPDQLFRNLGDGRFEDVSDRAGATFALAEVGRGAAFGDVDNDGCTDVLVSNNNGPVRLLRNGCASGNAWIGLRLVDESGRDALGARVAVLRPEGPPLWRRARSDGSFASASDPRVLVGLGASGPVAGVRVVWPQGDVEEWDPPPVGAYTTLRRGTGRGTP